MIFSYFVIVFAPSYILSCSVSGWKNILALNLPLAIMEAAECDPVRCLDINMINKLGRADHCPMLWWIVKTKNRLLLNKLISVTIHVSFCFSSCFIVRTYLAQCFDHDMFSTVVYNDKHVWCCRCKRRFFSQLKQQSFFLLLCSAELWTVQS